MIILSETMSGPKERLLRYAHLISALGHITSAAWLFHLTQERESMWQPVCRFTYDMWNKTAENVTYQIPAYTEYHFDVALAAFFFAFWSGVVHLLTLLLWKFFVSDMKKRRSTLRHFDYVVSASLMITVLASLSGVRDTMALLGISLSMATVILMGMWAERVPLKKDKLRLFLGACAVYIFMVWTPIFATFYGSIANSETDTPSFVYAIIWIMFVVFSSFAIPAWYNISKGDEVDYAAIELAFVILSLVSKVILHWMLNAGLINKNQKDRESSVYQVAGGAIGGGIVLAVVFRIAWKRCGKQRAFVTNESFQQEKLLTESNM